MRPSGALSASPSEETDAPCDTTSDSENTADGPLPLRPAVYGGIALFALPSDSAVFAADSNAPNRGLNNAPPFLIGGLWEWRLLKTPLSQPFGCE